MLVDGCLFVSNYASKKGAGIHHTAGQLSVVGSLFYKNIAGSDNVKAGEIGTELRNLFCLVKVSLNPAPLCSL